MTFSVKRCLSGYMWICQTKQQLVACGKELTSKFHAQFSFWNSWNNIFFMMQNWGYYIINRVSMQRHYLITATITYIMQANLILFELIWQLKTPLIINQIYIDCIRNGNYNSYYAFLLILQTWITLIGIINCVHVIDHKKAFVKSHNPVRLN